MEKFIHRLRQKPDVHKKSIAFGVSLTISIIVLVIWLISTIFYYTSPQSIKITYESTTVKIPEVSPFSVIGEQWNNMIGKFPNVFSTDQSATVTSTDSTISTDENATSGVILIEASSTPSLTDLLNSIVATSSASTTNKIQKN